MRVVCVVMRVVARVVCVVTRVARVVCVVARVARVVCVVMRVVCVVDRVVPVVRLVTAVASVCFGVECSRRCVLVVVVKSVDRFAVVDGRCVMLCAGSVEYPCCVLCAGRGAVVEGTLPACCADVLAWVDADSVPVETACVRAVSVGTISGCGSVVGAGVVVYLVVAEVTSVTVSVWVSCDIVSV